MISVGCEVIQEGDRLIPLPHSTGGSRTHVLVEFTGFRCMNCPTAAELAAELAKEYDPRLIVVAMHPASNPFTQGLYDYTCPAADTYYTQLGGTPQTSFPKGSLDLAAYEGDYLLDMSSWTSAIYRSAQDSTSIVISLSAAMDTTSREVLISSEWYSTGEDAIEMVYWLVEDSVAGMQLMPDGSYNDAYIHRHMLRGEIADQKPFVLDPAYDRRHCEIIAVAIDKINHTIRQAKQTHITIQ